MSKYKEEEMLLLKLKEGEDATIKATYDDMKKGFVTFMLKYFGVPREKAEEIYPESFTKFYFNIKNDRLVIPLQSRLATYLNAIGKHVFMKHNSSSYHKKIRLSEDLPDITESNPTLDFYDNEAQGAIVKKLLSSVGEKCSQLLTMIYIKEMSSAAVCEELGISALGTLRKRKFDCMQKMRDLLKKSNYKNELL